ncbi:MAG TPA: adenylate/guanylate cyclase domain-containing protein [Candidatus Eremiobacteraeota bacterium]|nr:MAG: Adenylate cyclase 2 [bacterium ADurb.Bin363]HPZ08310.1 adenylate/guanylate cyclase domain-containing protein [Candidatus Eremiobacteraeota bacterium]
MFIFSVEKDESNRQIYKLTGYEGLLRGNSFVLTQPSVSIGRNKNNNILINDARISRHHARIEILPDGIYLVDLNSTAGTYVNNIRITRAALKPGDKIQFYPPETKKIESDDKKIKEGQTHIVDKKIMMPATISLRDFLTQDKTKWVSTLKLSAMEEQVRDRKKLEILLSVTNALSRPEKIEVKIEEILAVLFEIMDLDRAAIWILSKNFGEEKKITTDLEPVFKYKIFRKKYDVNDEDEPVFSMSIIKKVLLEEEGILVKDALTDEEFKSSMSVKVQGIRTCVCVPLKTQNNLLGVLYADAQRPVDKFTEEDLKFVTAFSAQAAVAVENSLLHQKIENDAKLKSRFERFFSPNTIDTLIKKPEFVGKGGEEMFVTVLFSDIRNYTALSARKTPREVANMLNEYFPLMVKIVFRKDGTLEKYIGDALMAIWGAPISTEDHAREAVLAAIDMQKAVTELNQKWKSRGMETIEIGIGINTGNAFLGNIGDESFLQYAAIGDTTNLSARLCSCAAKGEILVSEQTYNLLKDYHLKFEELESIALKGITGKTRRFRVVF